MIRTFDGSTPQIHPSALVHDSAEVIGRVRLGPKASVWPLAVLRGDIAAIDIGGGTNIQDMSVVHTREGCPAVIGRRVTVGHGAVIHGARIADDCLIGMGAIVMESRIGRCSVVGAGAVVPKGMDIPPRSLVLGCPAKVVKTLKPGALGALRESAKDYEVLAAKTRVSSKPAARP